MDLKIILQNLIATDWEGLVGRSIKNCHCIGLNSIMLFDNGKSRFRMFYTKEDHVMWKNHPLKFRSEMSVAFHPHHCDLHLEKIFGEVINIKAEVVERARCDGNFVVVSKYAYRSKLRGEEPGFEFLEHGIALEYSRHFLEAGVPYRMKATDVHTVFVPKRNLAAWLVYEGQENMQYESFCYGPKMPEISSELYQPMAKDELSFDLSQILSTKF